MIREFIPNDIVFIEKIGSSIDQNYKFKINPYTKCFVYEINTQIVGFIVFSIMYEKAEIIDMAISDEYQRQNIGTQLIAAVAKVCQENNCDSMTLEVRQGNEKAICFYKKNGFREISMRKSYYQDGEDALVMIKMVV